MGRKILRGQVSTEVVLICAVMLFFLLAIYLSNEHMRQQTLELGRRLQASAAANQLALAVDKAASGGDGARVPLFNSVGTDVKNVTIYDGRAVRAYYRGGGYVSVPLSTNQTSSLEVVPINEEIVVRNSNGTIVIEAA